MSIYWTTWVKWKKKKNPEKYKLPKLVEEEII